MTISVTSYRQIARDKIRGSWGKLALMYFVSFLIMSISSATVVLGIFITPVMAYGLVITSLKLTRGESIQFSDIFSGFQFHYWRAVWLGIVKPFFLCCWSVPSTIIASLIINSDIIQGIYTEGFSVGRILLLLLSDAIVLAGAVVVLIKVFAYSLSSHVLYDQDLGACDSVTESRFLMEDVKGRLFRLYISFTGWFLLSILTCGILLFWVIPYVSVAKAELYNPLHFASTVEREVPFYRISSAQNLQGRSSHA